MLLCELFQDTLMDTVLVPMVTGSAAAVEIPRYAYVLAGSQAGRLGVRANPVQAAHRPLVERLFGDGDGPCVWMSVRAYQKPHWKVDLAAVRPENLRLFDSKKGHLLHRGDLPPGAVVRGYGLPPLMGSRED